MSGGDGRGPGNTGLGHNGGKPSGNVNGSSGHGSGSHGGGNNPNSGPGWGTSHVPGGPNTPGGRDIHNYNPGEFGGSGNKPSGNGGHSGSHGGGSGHGQTMAMAFGFPELVSPGIGGLGLTISGDALSTAIADIFAVLKGSFKFSAWGIALYGILPTEIAKDDPNMMSKIVTSLPADTVTESPVSSLPLDQATVSVTKRVTDVVKDERQHIAVVAGVPMSVPVVDAKPTNRPGVFSATVPGLPALEVSTGKGIPASTALPRGITEDKDRIERPAGFTFGGSSHEAVIRFPKESGQAPVYVSVTNVLTPEQVKQRQDEENRRQQEWDTTHPVEVAEQELDATTQELSAAQAVYDQADKRHQAAVTGFQPFSSVDYGAEKAVLASLEAKMANLEKEKERAINEGDGMNPQGPGHAYLMRLFKEQGVLQPQLDAKKATVTGYEQAKKELDDSTAALNTALENRKQKEKKAKDAENKLNEEKNKPRKGTKDYGHDYHPAPKTEDIKGLGELQEGKPKTPKQGGGGKRARWYGDKRRKIYEWDSQHGELEGYRASDGEHLGAFDPKTGKQVKGPDPKRNISKYL